ncbi:MAG: hypothetical protein OXG39_17345 [Chloroflexi bacterium]|nr:hypothetical protein [Chloroflexota bacterium]
MAPRSSGFCRKSAYSAKESAGSAKVLSPTVIGISGWLGAGFAIAGKAEFSAKAAGVFFFGRAGAYFGMMVLGAVDLLTG